MYYMITTTNFIDLKATFLHILKRNLVELYRQILCSAVLAHYFLNERLHIFGVVGCALCLVGSTTIVLHAPQETQVSSVKEVWNFATEPGTLYIYTHNLIWI